MSKAGRVIAYLDCWLSPEVGVVVEVQGSGAEKICAKLSVHEAHLLGAGLSSLAAVAEDWGDFVERETKKDEETIGLSDYVKEVIEGDDEPF